MSASAPLKPTVKTLFAGGRQWTLVRLAGVWVAFGHDGGRVEGFALTGETPVEEAEREATVFLRGLLPPLS
jgi:hypothetical protein